MPVPHHDAGVKVAHFQRLYIARRDNGTVVFYRSSIHLSRLLSDQGIDTVLSQQIIVIADI